MDFLLRQGPRRPIVIADTDRQ
jgi:hypothetical protein